MIEQVWDEWIAELRALIEDKDAHWDDRHDAVMTFRHANEGLVVTEPRGSVFGELLAPADVPPVWHADEVAQTLLVVATDQQELDLIQDEAGEALALIWLHRGSFDPDAFGNSHPLPRRAQKGRSARRNQDG